VSDLFLSHGHLDHAAGLPFLLSQRTLQRFGGTRVYCPRQVAPALADFVTAAERLEEGAYRWEMVPLAAGERVALGREHVVEAFAVDHVVPTLGYHLFRRKARLAARYVGLEGVEIAALRARGEEVSETVEEHWLTYSADSGPALFDLEPRLFAARVLLLECTFLGAEHQDKGERYKHLHLEDIARREGEFANEAVVLHHLSRRFRLAELRAEVGRALPRLAPRITIIVEGEQG
jgi:ribonuclease Z